MSDITIAPGVGSLYDILDGFTALEGASVNLDGTYSDDDGPGSQWTVGEAISDDAPAIATYTYQGYVTIGGKNYPVLHPNAGPTVYLVGYDFANLAAFEAALVSEFGTNIWDDSWITTGDSLPCFMAGSQIATPSGQTAVEHLKIGDLVRTADGRNVPILWVGQAHVEKMFNGQANIPVRIKQGALGAGLPEQDLLVSPDHGMVVEDMIVNASALVNHDTILFEPSESLPDRFTYYHIELKNHDVILANGAASETYIDTPGRSGFANYREYLDLYGAERLIPAMTMPRIASARMLPEPLRDRLGISQPDITSNVA